MQDNLNVLVLLAGGGAAFQEAGAPYPKNLVEISGRALFDHVLEPLGSLAAKGNLVCMVTEEECRRWHTDAAVQLQYPVATILFARTPTGGAACTALLAIDKINNERPLVITNGDIVIRDDLSRIIESFESRQLDAGVVVFEDIHPRWSFVRVDENELVVEAAEKRPISKLATTGFFYFRKGADFVNGARKMLGKDAHVDGQFYVCPLLNELVLLQKRIGIHRISKDNYFSLKDPRGVASYEAGLEQ